MLLGCANGYKQFYTSNGELPLELNPQFLKEGEVPEVFGSDDIERDIKILRSKEYIVLGYSSFNGELEDIKNAQAQAKAIGATLILTNSEFTNVQSTTSTLFLPDNKTTYQSGTVNANTTYTGNVYGSSNTNATYSGVSTTYGTMAVPVTTHQRRYDQQAIYLVKTNYKIKVGLGLLDLTPELRTELQRNTGVLVDLVFENKPAFLANVLIGDVIIAIDGIPVTNVDRALELIDKASTSIEFTILRRGETINIKADI